MSLTYDRKQVCLNKLQYKTRTEAVHQQTFLQLKRNDYEKFYVYRCVECTQYHVSKNGISDEIKDEIYKNIYLRKNITLFKRISCWASILDVSTNNGIFRVFYDTRKKKSFYIMGNVEDNQVYSFYVPKENFLSQIGLKNY